MSLDLFLVRCRVLIDPRPRRPPPPSHLQLLPFPGAARPWRPLLQDFSPIVRRKIPFYRVQLFIPRQRWIMPLLLPPHTPTIQLTFLVPPLRICLMGKWGCVRFPLNIALNKSFEKRLADWVRLDFFRVWPLHWNKATLLGNSEIFTTMDTFGNKLCAMRSSRTISGRAWNWVC